MAVCLSGTQTLRFPSGSLSAMDGDTGVRWGVMYTHTHTPDTHTHLYATSSLSYRPVQWHYGVWVSQPAGLTVRLCCCCSFKANSLYFYPFFQYKICRILMVVWAAQYITGAKLPAIQDLYTRRCQRKAPQKMIKDSSHPSHRLFSLLPHVKQYQSTKSRTKRLLNSFDPQVIRLLNNLSNGHPDYLHWPPLFLHCCYSVYYLCIVTNMYILPRLTCTQHIDSVPLYTASLLLFCCSLYIFFYFSLFSKSFSWTALLVTGLFVSISLWGLHLLYSAHDKYYDLIYARLMISEGEWLTKSMGGP
jgi:hypothetical protein